MEEFDVASVLWRMELLAGEEVGVDCEVGRLLDGAWGRRVG